MPPPPNLDVLLLQIQYPGMSYVESEVTRAWLRAHGADYDSIEFNVRLGEGVQLGGEFDESTRTAATLLTQKRADAIARRDGNVTIVEAKVRIGLPVIGQLLGYRSLWQREHPETRTVRLLAIGRAVQPDLEPIIREQGVEIEVFPRAGA